VSVEPVSPAGPPRERLAGARERMVRAAAWAQESVPGATWVVAASERERFAAAGLLAGGIAYRLFFWLVPLGLVLAAAASFWVEADPAGMESAAREIGLGGAATRAAMDAIQHDAHARWYFLVAGASLLVWFGAGVVRSLHIAHAVAWRLRPEKPRRAYRAGLVFTGIAVGGAAISTAAAWMREQLGGAGVVATLALVLLYAAVWLWVSTKLPHRGTWRVLVPGAVVVALGLQLLHLFAVLYLAPKLGRSSALYGALGAATVILLWLFIIARLIVAGAFLNAARWERAAHVEATA
jgi:uncharacterized BrkB/YihY/UPF0761 family membrane protein